MPELPTVDLTGVQILSTGGPIHGVGSPPEGDQWTTADLNAIAAANRDLADEVRAPNKIGHSDSQKLAGVSEGELPSIGWLDGRSFRVSEDGTKLLADVKRVPEKVASLLKAGAYRTRSVELSRVKSQKTGKEYPWVTTGLAWLGSKLPAVRTLDDVTALYEGEDSERRFVQVDENEEHNFARILETATELAASGLSRSRVDSRPMPDKTYTEAQRKTFADATGLEADKVTDEMLATAGVAVEKDEEEEKQLNLADEAVRKLETKVDEESAERKKLEQRLYTQERDTFIENDAVKAGKIEPGQREYIELMYDADPAKARKYVETLPVQQHLVREFGVDDDEDLDDAGRERKLEDQERSYTDEYETIYGDRPMKFARSAA